MDWRTWTFQRLINDAAVTAVIPAAQIHGAGSLVGRPEPLPAAIIKFTSDADRTSPAAEATGLEVWVHDEVGSYDGIDEILSAIKVSLTSAVMSENGAYPPVWEGNSQDLSDDLWDTLVKNSSYELLSRKGT